MSRWSVFRLSLKRELILNGGTKGTGYCAAAQLSTSHHTLSEQRSRATG